MAGGRAEAANQSIGLNQSVQNTARAAIDTAGAQNVSQSMQTLTYDAQGLPQGFSARASLERSEPDYSSYFVRDSAGNERALSRIVPERAEYRMRAGVTRAWGPHQVSLDLGRSLSASPFRATELAAVWDESLYGMTTHLGISATGVAQTQPRSSFIDRDQKLKSRPENVRGYRFATYWDQVLGERAKNRFELAASRRIEERPLNLGFTERAGYALTDRLFAQAEIRRAWETRSELHNERGYFGLWGGALSLTIEPVYDFLITPSYGLLVEREDDPRVESILQTATDQYGLAFEMPVRIYSSDAKLQGSFVYERSNTRADAKNFSAGVLWTL